MARLQSVTGALSRALPRHHVLQVIATEVLAAMGASSGAILEATPDGSFQLAHSVGIAPDVVKRWSHIPADAELPLRDVAATQEPVFVESPDEWLESYAAPDSGEELSDGAWAVLPLIIGDQLIGAITLAFPTRRSFSEVDRQFMTALGGQCAQALERGRLFDAEQRARADAESASRAKSQFLAVMSHELRTPLTAIIGYADLLHSEVSGPLAPKQKEQLDRMRASAWHLLQLISEILSLTRIEAGREEVDIQPVDLSAISRECLAAVQLQAQQKGLRAELSLPDRTVVVQTDAGKLRQIVLNLLSNAVKFTEKGHIGVTLRPQPEGGAVIAVEDTGPGIARADRERIFESFTQLDQSATRAVGGAGLGLSVSRRLAELIGVTLTLESDMGQGTTFYVHLGAYTGEHKA